MAIAFDLATTNTTPSGNVYTFSHTITGTNILLIVAVSAQESGLDVTDVTTSVTYNGVSLTRLRQDRRASAGADTGCDIWYLAGAATGAHNVVATLTDSTPAAVVGAISFTGVDQTTPIEANNGTNGDSNNPSQSVTTLTANAWVFGVVAQEADATAASLTIGASETERWDTQPSGNAVLGGGFTEGPVASPGSVTINPTSTRSDNWTISLAAIKPAADATTTSTSSSISTSSTSTSTSVSTTSSSTSTSISTSSTSTSISTSTSVSISTSSTSSSTSVSTSTSISTSSTSSSTSQSTSTSISTSSTSSSTSQSTSTSISTSSTSSSTSESTSTSISTSSTSSSTSVSTSTTVSTSSTSTSTSASTSTSISTSSTSSSISTSVSTSISTSSTSSSTSISTSSTSSSTSISASTSISTSSTSSSTSISSSTSVTTSTSTSSTSASTSTTTVLPPDIRTSPRGIIRPDNLYTDSEQPRGIAQQNNLRLRK